MVVVFGHWLMAAPVITATGLEANHLLTRTTWTHYLTWILQVMPIFFFVGGFANAASWRASARAGSTYGAWLRARLRPAGPDGIAVLVVWTAGAYTLLQSGFDPELLEISHRKRPLSQVWFLATYVAVVAFTPLSLAAWNRWGWASVVATGLIAGLIDLISLGLGITWVGYLNYLFMWGTVHSLGYAWADSRLGAIRHRLLWSLASLVATAALVGFGPYPVAMVGLDTVGVTNSQPPKVTLLTLAIFQAEPCSPWKGPRAGCSPRPATGRRRFSSTAGS